MSEEPPSSVTTDAVVRVAVVGDAPVLDRALDAIRGGADVAVSRYGTVEAALDRVASGRLHGIVCRPEHVREGVLSDPTRDFDERLPTFVVGDPAETVPALEAGATDCVRPDDPPAAVAARVSSAAHRYRLEREVDEPTPRGMLDGAASLVAVVDDDGTVVAASPAAEAVLGYTTGELEGRPLSQVVHPSDRTALADVRRSVADAGLGARRSESIRFRHGDGSRVVHRTTVTNRRDDPAVAGLVVTIERRDGRSVGADELASAIDAAGLALFAVGERWEIRYASDRAAVLFERPPEVGSVLWDLLPDATVSAFSERLREARRTDARVEFAVPVEGSDRTTELTATPTPAGVVVADVSGETAPGTPDADEGDPPLEPVLESLEDGICVLEDGTITYANAALFAHLSAETLEGRPIADVTDDALAAAIRERAAPPLRWLDPVAYVHGDGPHSRRFDVFVTPLSARRTVCLVRPASRSPTAQFDRLDRAVGHVDPASAPSALRESAAGAFVDAFDLGTARWLLSDGDGFRPAEFAVERDDRESPEGGPRIGDAAVAHDESRLREILDAGTPTVLDPGSVADAAFEVGASIVVPVGDRGLVAATLGERGDAAVNAGSLAAMEAFAAHLTAALDAAEARERRRELERERDRAVAAQDAARTHLAVVGRGIDALLEARTRADVAEALTTSVSDLAGVDLAWTGSVDLSTGAITPRSVVGAEAYLEAVTVTTDSAEPTGRAAREGEAVTAPELGSESASDWARTAREHGLRSALSLPLAYESVLYGTVTAYAKTPSAFDDQTERACDLLAAVGAYALATLDLRRTLAAGVATEIEVLAPADADPIAGLAAALDATLRIAATVPRREGGATVFCTVDEPESNALAESTADVSDVVDGVESVERRANGQLVVVTDERTIADALVGHGGRLRDVAPAASGVRLAFELPENGETRAILSGLESAFGPFDPRVRRQTERTGTRPWSGRTVLERSLTESQRQTLAAAYRAGYFEWPRERTGEEVAALLGVSQPTFNRHFRAAERNLFDGLFDGREGDRID